MRDYGVFLAGSYRCLSVIRALVSPSRSVSLGTHNPTVNGGLLIAIGADITTHAVLVSTDSKFGLVLPLFSQKNKITSWELSAVLDKTSSSDAVTRVAADWR